MPYLRFKGFQSEVLEKLAPLVVDEFAYIVKIPKEKVKIELLPIRQITNSPLSVEIQMFQREQETHDALASSMNRIFHEFDCQHVHIYFVILSPTLYYKEGKPLKVIPDHNDE
ncbi:DUF1904 family protein [Paenibacillus allorhizosphaerae]|uniref:DUF1904 family protein n=1 Tax=Paenibacillus allorhizosphaerae TaxID=2849866 RepID=A0ABN7TEX1_9BACL|nr:DUF1904 family protein [Paenibacillus allorhizosphaerae]CAG7616469.1 hypothetical protein PAECIP111802_00291 [Paenibacillus allorhizosphaerae]